MFALYILKDRKPVPVDELEWAQWFGAHHEERVVGRWDFAGTEVSTAFLGVDHQVGGGPPLVFETAWCSRREGRSGRPVLTWAVQRGASWRHAL